MRTDKELLPEWYNVKEQPFYIGDGHLNVIQLERLCSDFTDYVHQQMIIKQALLKTLEQYNGITPDTAKEMQKRINGFENELREAFYKGRDIKRYDRGIAIFERPTFEGYLRELDKANEQD